MKQLKGSELVEALSWRYACKKFDANKKLSPAEWQALEESLLLSPSSYGLQPWKFLVVQNPELREKLRAVSWNQAQVEDCSHYVVFLALQKLDEAYVDHYLGRISQVRGTQPEQLGGFREMMVRNVVQGKSSTDLPQWAARQAYIALGNFMTAAAVLGVDTCPLEGLDASAYDEILGLKEGNYRTLCACAVGFRAGDDAYARLPKVRFPASELVRHLE